MVTVLPSPRGVGVMALTSTSLPAFLPGLLEQFETELALVVAVRAEQMGRDAQARSQGLDGETGGLAGDLDIA
ncbi:hypothetical protein LMCDFJHI_01067 [Aeromonas salmonicida]